jgi:signal transduction histidine kinase
MTKRGRALVARLMATQVVAWGTMGLLIIAFAPRLLLLDAAVVDGSARLALWEWVATMIWLAAVTLAATRRLRPVLDAFGAGDLQLAPTELLALHSLPARVAALGVGGTLVIAAATLAPPLRPATNDLWTQTELVILAVTMASVGALPAYVAMRASVAKVMELMPVATARAALELLETRRSGIARLRHRMLAAVAAPVAFVALGALLLVHAHLRAFEATSREDEAAVLARGVFDNGAADERGGRDAIEEARSRGFQVSLEPSSAVFGVAHDDAGYTVVAVPLTEAHALVRFRMAHVTRRMGIYLALALIAVAFAGILGGRIGHAFGADVVLATRELEATGVADVVRGGRIRGDARFYSVTALMKAADELGGVFREFASAQQRAIDARAATERMRGLFLASMSHDLKAPLNAILGFAALVSRGQLGAGQRESVAIIEQRGRELLYLIDTILDAARVEAGELTMSPEWMRVDDVVTSAVLETRALTVGLSVDITGEIQPDLPLIFVDASRLSQAITAMLLVAARFAEHGHVVVRAALPAIEERLRIDVEVTGRVIGAADRKKVFDAFKHADRARRHGGLGLGPSLARAIVELQGGGIDVETTEAGGTVFHMWVPSDRPRTSIV